MQVQNIFYQDAIYRQAANIAISNFYTTQVTIGNGTPMQVAILETQGALLKIGIISGMPFRCAADIVDKGAA